MDETTTERLQIGRVFARATGALGRNWLLLIGITVVFTLVNNAVSAFVMRSAVISPAAPLALFQSPAYWLSLLWSLVSGFLLYAALVHAVVLDLGGTRPKIGPVFAAAVASVLPLIGMAIISYFAFVLAFLLFIIPGLMLLVRWSVAVPALVEERVGIFGALKRSNALTRGSRWRIFALGIILIVVISIPSFLSAAVIGVSGLRGAGLGTITPAILVFGLVTALATLFALAVLASTYVELRYVKDGIAPDRLAEVFA